jgi:hypothetical protein
MAENEIGSVVLETAVTVHRELGPGVVQAVYALIVREAVMKTGITRCVNGL